jgi:TPP-dependent pyruvate/acetoin dehydrogenase alpha subunit
VTTWLADTPAALRESAQKQKDRAMDTLRRAEEALAEADRWEAENAERAEAARLQRNARAAATRARNADPFGFKARGR